jgi:hypothetical protein
MFDVLKTFANDELVEIYPDRDNTDIFFVGYIVTCNEEHCVMSCVSPEGRMDGFSLELVENILNVQSDTAYIGKIKVLMKSRNTALPMIEFKDDDLVSGMLAYAKGKNSLVSIQVSNSRNVDSRGYLESIEYGICKIQQVDEYGMSNGFGFLKTDDISRVSFDDEKEKGIDILYQSYKPV